MFTLEQLKALAEKKVGEAQAIYETAKTEDRELKDDERTLAVSLTEEATEHTAEITRRLGDEKAAAALAGVISSVDIPVSHVVSSDATPYIELGEPGWKSDPTYGFGTPRKFLQAIMDARPGSVPDNLKALAVTKATAGSDEHSTFDDAYGGYTMPETWAPGVMKIEPESDPAASLVRRVPMTTQVVHFNARTDKDHSSSVTGGLQVYRRGEADTSQASREAMEQIELKATGLFGLAYATEELLAHSPISFTAMLEQDFGTEFASKILKERINGTGVGQFEGLLITPCKIAIVAEDNQVADSIVLENIINMRARCYGYGKAIWIANHDTLPQLMKLMFDTSAGTKTPMWIASARDGEPDRLFGRPLFMSEYAKTLGDEGDIILCDWSQVMEGTLTSISGLDSIHVRFTNHERTFKFWMENDSKHSWRSALTPVESSITLSPVLTIAART